ncbi:MAG: protein-L-isoaspartate O-methyltransferase [Candidatus Andersenbacteria bacterium]|nr:protein-L-isoaspartate O-methyltransferase [Candidatus Andersenbacteria bacterium]
MESRERLVEHLIELGVLYTASVIDAFRAIDRRDFVRPDMAEAAYVDTALPIGLGQTISQPYTVAFMLERLQPQAGQRILDVGSGSGWQAALLAHIVGEAGKVVALEIVSELCDWGRQNVARYNFIERGVVEMHCCSGWPGFPPAAPYDRIIAAAAGEQVPDAWLTQTKPGGCIVAPVGSSIMRLMRQADGTWVREDYPGFAFVPLVGEA